MTRKTQIRALGDGAAGAQPVVPRDTARTGSCKADHDAAMEAYARVEKRYRNTFRKLARS